MYICCKIKFLENPANYFQKCNKMRRSNYILSFLHEFERFVQTSSNQIKSKEK